MSWEGWTIVISALGLAFGVALIVLGYKRRRNGPTQDRGSNPDHGHHFMSSTYGSGRESGSRTWRVPKNPNDYAKIFAPTKTDGKK